ncbi:MAG: AAA family ATPase [bacterium]|nr:AAA family ATPase [bacterium]MDY4100421.1 AAA family ATPase [Lachnospiraceae bacterium]
MNHYITQIKIEHLRHISDICIDLKPDARTNLLLTGKNGSGKTTVLQAMRRYLKAIVDGELQHLEDTYVSWLNLYEGQLETAKNENEKYTAQQNYQNTLQRIKQYRDGVSVVFNHSDGLDGLFKEGKYILAYYGADRKTGIIKQSSIEDVVLDTCYSFDSNPGNVLLKYLVHLKTQQAYARNENDMTTVHMLDQWFERFVEALKVLLDNESIEIKYDYKNYNFEIIENGRNAFGFDQLSDGYSAAIQIVADLILRMEQNWLKKGTLSSYDVEGIVMIDELETHLHIGLQKTILPFLTSFFPKIQFIVSTHSPYILNSVENCVIYDLEKKIRMEDMSCYSAEGIVEGYFELDSYSENLMKKVKRYQELVETDHPTDEERAERATLFTEFKQLSGDLSREAKDAFEEIEDRRKQNDKICS